MKRRRRYGHLRFEIRMERFFLLIELLLLLCGSGLLFVSKYPAFAVLGFFAWNAFFYVSGCRENGVDEFDQEECLGGGLRKVFVSWGVLILLAEIAALVYLGYYFLFE